ncbi:MAG: TlpA disulfide reductase family protein, partial [Methylococcaceae bacterium]|nr:TlpA disulfide reductase family protein [Methylococcaceae bacterium]
QSLPFLDEMHGQLKHQGFEVLGVNLDENRPDAEEFLSKYPIHFISAVDPVGECPKLFGVEAMPSSYLIDRHGKVRHVLLGFHNGERGEIRAKIQGLLAES